MSPPNAKKRKTMSHHDVLSSNEPDTPPPKTPVRILIINPNTNVSMTESLKPVVDSLGYRDVEYTYWTCPVPGVYSINSPNDSKYSAEICMPHLMSELPLHDAFLVACYSQHPLVAELKIECNELTLAATHAGGSLARKYVTGILEASVGTSLNLIASSTDDEDEMGGREVFGIVSTADIWEKALDDAVGNLLGTSSEDLKTSAYAGCTTTGLDGNELHDLSSEEVGKKLKAATKQLLVWTAFRKQRLTAICLGCAGMAGLEKTVREACVEQSGDDGKLVHIVDGVKAGIGMLINLVRAGS